MFNFCSGLIVELCATNLFTQPFRARRAATCMCWDWTVTICNQLAINRIEFCMKKTTAPSKKKSTEVQI